MILPHRSEPDVVVLHALRCVGASGVGRLTDAVARTDIDVEDVLLALAAQGLVANTRGPFGGWSLTDAGRAANADRIAGELADAGARSRVEEAFDRFLELNPCLLDVCTAWQLRGPGDASQLNDHLDAGYDARVLRRLAALDREARVVCRDLAAALDRFAAYGVRLAASLVRARTGVTGAVADDLDSYHAVWFQLHEDLLVTLGRPRW